MLDWGLVKRNTAPLFQVEFDPTLSPNTPLFLSSGIRVKGIGTWLELFIGTKKPIDWATANRTIGGNPLALNEPSS